MNKIIGISFFLVLFIMGGSVYAQTSSDSITTIANLEKSIQTTGYEGAVGKALESGVLSMDQIAQTVLKNTSDLNPVQVIAVLTSNGIPRKDIVNAAADAGISAGIVNAGIDRGETMKTTSVAQRTSEEDAGLGFGEGLLPVRRPPSFLTGRPGGKNPKDPISQSSM